MRGSPRLAGPAGTTASEVFDAEVCTIYRDLGILDRRQESVHRYALFIDSAAAVGWIGSGSIGPGQRFAIAAMEVCDRVLSRDNEVAIRWVPTHHEIAGNEKADELDGSTTTDGVQDECRWETSLSLMTRIATEARSRSTSEWIFTHVGAGPPAREEDAIISLGNRACVDRMSSRWHW